MDRCYITARIKSIREQRDQLKKEQARLRTQQCRLKQLLKQIELLEEDEKIKPYLRATK